MIRVSCSYYPEVKSLTRWQKFRGHVAVEPKFVIVLHGQYADVKIAYNDEQTVVFDFEDAQLHKLSSSLLHATLSGSIDSPTKAILTLPHGLEYTTKLEDAKHVSVGS